MYRMKFLPAVSWRMHRAAILIISALFVTGCSKSNSNGETIFKTGKNASGTAIMNDIDRSALSDAETIVSCATCHGEDRLGRKNPLPALGPFSAPDITPASLSQSTSRRPGYSVSSLRAALTTGRNSAGKGLHYPMPRWRFTGPDLDDLVAFLLKENS